MSEDWDHKSPVNGQPLPRGKPFDTESARESAQKSHKVQRENGMIRNALLRELAKTKVLKDGREIGGYDAMAEAAIANALKNPRYWELVRDSIGEKPTDNSNIAHSFDGDVVVSMKRNDEA